MLTIKNVIWSDKAEAYFRKDSTVRKEHYYTQDGSIASARWWGRGAERLGLQGTVSKAEFGRVLVGHLPNGVHLMYAQPTGKSKAPKIPQGKNQEEGAGKRRVGRRAALDLTFSAPKSLSVLGLVAGHDEVIEAHSKAVEAALAMLQNEATEARKTENQVTRVVKTDNLLVARFEHETSREHDPQVHTHCVVMSATERSDGQWCSIWNSELYRRQRFATLTYRAALAKELQAAGYEVRTTPRGELEIAGVPDEVCRAFSTRRSQIEEHMAERGESGAAAAQQAAYDTRKAKVNKDANELVAQWRETASSHGFDHRGLVGDKPTVLDADAVRSSADSAVAWSIEHLSERRSVLERQELRSKALTRVIGTATLTDVDAAIQRAVEGRQLSVLPRAVTPEHKRREVVYTTPELQRMEKQFLALMRRTQRYSVPIAPRRAVVSRAEALGLSSEQRAAAELAVAAPDMVLGVTGFAGTGKTRSLQAVREVAEHAGWRVVGMAPSAAAARVLEEDAGFGSKTLARHLIDQQRRKGDPLVERELWVLDEAGMVSTRQMRDLLLSAMAANKRGKQVRVLLTGDGRQLASIEAGCPFELLREHGMRVAELKHIRRQSPEKAAEHLQAKGVGQNAVRRGVQRAEGLRDAVREVAEHRRAQQALSIIQRVGCVIEDTKPEPDAAEKPSAAELHIKRLQAVANNYLSRNPEERADTLVVTLANSDRRRINQYIREGLQAEGRLGQDKSAVVLTSKKLTKAQMKMADCYEPGDVVRFGRAHKTLGVDRGEYLRVAEVKGDVVHLERLHGDSESEPVIWRPSGQRVEVYEAEKRQLAVGDVLRWTRGDTGRGFVNGDVVEVVRVDQTASATVRDRAGETHQIDLERDRHWDHAYVSTVYGSQGANYKHVVIHMPSVHRELLGQQSLYVAISRAQHGATLYTDAVEEIAKHIDKDLGQDSAVRELRRTHRNDAEKAEQTQVKRSLMACAQAGGLKRHEHSWQVNDAVVEAWRKRCTTHPEQRAVMIARSATDVQWLNQTARDELLLSGRLQGASVPVQTRRGELLVAQGDDVVFWRVDKRLGIETGMFGRVLKIDSAQMTADISGREVVIDLKRYGDIGHGYAVGAREAALVRSASVFVALNARDAQGTAHAALSRQARHVEMHWSTVDYRDERALIRTLSRKATDKAAPQDLGALGRSELYPEVRDAKVADREGTLRQVAEAWRGGRTAEALGYLRRSGGLQSHDSCWRMREVVACRWAELSASQSEQRTVVLTAGAYDAELVSDEIRMERMAAGKLSDDEWLVRTARGDKPMAVGEQVVLLEPIREHGVLGGEAAVVQDIKGTKVEVSTGQQRFWLDTSTYSGLDYGYAVDVERAGRLHADQVIAILSPGLDTEGAHVLMTRHTGHLEVHWSTMEFRDEAAAVAELSREATEAKIDAGLHIDRGGSEQQQDGLGY